MPSRRVVALAVALPVLILGTIFGAAVWGVVSGYRAILAGPTVDAVVVRVTRCTSSTWQCSNRNDFAVWLRFDTPHGRETAPAAAAEPLPAGEHVLIRYDPEKPRRRVLILSEWEREKDSLPVLAALIGVILLVGLLAVVVIRLRVHGRSGEADLSP